MIIAVVCALIVNDDGKVLAACRSSSMDLPGKWEFPGGKLEDNEIPQEAVVREIREELDVNIKVHDAMPAQVHHYPNKSIQLIPFICSFSSGTISLREHQSWGWFNHEELLQLDWAEADVPVLNDYLEQTR